MGDYIKVLQNKPAEIQVLVKDLLIGVTSFFRDEDAFLKLEQKIIPMLFENHNPNATIKVWCAGCSTGEEAYSIAILIHEYMEKSNNKHTIQIFATDIDHNALEIARAGVYSRNVISDLTSERLNKCFILDPDNDTYRIVQSIREMLIFSEQSLIKDPPFSKLDLISCRNLLIYLSSDLQKKIIPLFHYALKPKGVLFLGISETIGNYETQFEVLDQKLKFFRRRPISAGMEETSVSEIVKPLLDRKPNTSITGAKRDELNLHIDQLNNELRIKDEYLQTANEELETSIQELQSINEELSTVNTELQIKVRDLIQANNDMNNLLSGTNIATIFLDCDQNIMRFTPTANKIINFISSDIGRPVAHIVPNFLEYNQMHDDVEVVLETLTPKNIVVQTLDKNWYEMIIQPYRTIENVVEGVVLTFVNITEAKNAKDQLTISETSYRTLFETSQEGILIIDGVTGKIKNVNPYLMELLSYPKQTLIEKQIWEIGLLKDLVANKEAFLDLQLSKYCRYKNLPIETSDGRKIDVEFICNAYAIDQSKIVQCNIRVLK